MKKKLKIFDRYGRVAATDEKFTGSEPNWDGCGEWPIDKFMKERSRMFTFYNYYCSSKDLFDDLLKWMSSNTYTKEQIKIVKSAGETCVNVVYLKLARAMNLGMLPTRDDVEEYLNKMDGISNKEAHDDFQAVKSQVDAVVRQGLREKKEKASLSNAENVVTISPLERLSNKVNETIISELEAMIDDGHWAESQTKVIPINLTSLLKAHSIPVKGLKEVYAWLERYKISLQNCLDRDNEFDTEGWSFLTKPGVRSRLKAIDDMITQLDKFAASNKTVRKVRKPKIKSADTQVKNLKYKSSDENFGVSSVSPLVVPGAKTLYAFNTKTRKLIVYESESADGFAVKGTTLQSFDTNKSFELTLRKPDDILPIIVNKSNKQITKALDLLKTKKKTPNGRINNETILLKTF